MFKSLVKDQKKVNIISRALGFLDNGKFNKQIFKKFDEELQQKRNLKGITYFFIKFCGKWEKII